jgi:transcriptional regulator with XRE-family HTH domain
VNQIDNYVGRRLRARRRFMGMTQHDLAQACGLRFQQIQTYECAANRISAARLWELAAALDVPVSYFFEGSGPPAPQEIRDLLQAYNQLGEGPRRRLLDLVTAMRGDIEPSGGGPEPSQGHRAMRRAPPPRRR